MGEAAIHAERRWTRSDQALGWLALVGVVLALSMSSTLVKRAHSPGVLLAFWRMVVVTLVWNGYLWSTGRRVTGRDLRQVVIPGVLFGLNLTVFFVGATHNSVANAALLGSLAPFVIVPVGGVLFAEALEPVALAFALVAFGGVALVLFSAPAIGDASVQGNVLGFAAMLLWSGYVVATRHFRREMDVATFMAAICPIATVAVLPLALAEGDLFGLSRTGWAYVVVLALVVGMAGHGLNVFAQRSIPIGTIGIAQVVQPALAVIWSFLLLGEIVRGWQVVGITLVMGGLLAFLVLNDHRRPGPTPRPPDPAR